MHLKLAPYHSLCTLQLYLSFIKRGKDDLDPRGYRPISLLNCDQKILAKVLANCLSKVIGSIIHMDQTGFIPNRYRFDNIRKLVNLQYLVYDSIHPIIILSLDAAKAFDCVKWTYLFETLERFGFGQNFMMDQNFIQYSLCLCFD